MQKQEKCFRNNSLVEVFHKFTILKTRVFIRRLPLSNKILEITGGYTAAFMMLPGLTMIALVLNVFIRKP